MAVGQAAAMGARIAELRSARGWSQGHLARRLVDAGLPNYYQMTVSRTEKGERALNVFEAYTIADVFGITIDQLAGRESVTSSDGSAGLREAIHMLEAELKRRAA